MFILFIQAFADYTAENRATVENFMAADAGRSKTAHLMKKFNLTTREIEDSLLSGAKRLGYFTKDLANDLLAKAETIADKFVANKGSVVNKHYFNWGVKCAAKAYADKRLTKANHTLPAHIVDTAERAVETAYANASSHDTLNALDKIIDALREHVADLILAEQTNKATHFLDTFRRKVDEKADDLREMRPADADHAMRDLVYAAAHEVRGY